MGNNSYDSAWSILAPFLHEKLCEIRNHMEDYRFLESGFALTSVAVEKDDEYRVVFDVMRGTSTVLQVFISLEEAEDDVAAGQLGIHVCAEIGGEMLLYSSRTETNAEIASGFTTDVESLITQVGFLDDEVIAGILLYRIQNDQRVLAVLN